MPSVLMRSNALHVDQRSAARRSAFGRTSISVQLHVDSAARRSAFSCTASAARRSAFSCTASAVRPSAFSCSAFSCTSISVQLHQHLICPSVQVYARSRITARACEKTVVACAYMSGSVWVPDFRCISGYKVIAAAPGEASQVVSSLFS